MRTNVSIDALRQCAALVKCEITTDKEAVKLQFPKLEIRLSPDFDATESYFQLRTAAGWMESLRETINTKDGEEVQS